VIVEKDGWYYLFFGANDIQNDRQVGRHRLRPCPAAGGGRSRTTGQAAESTVNAPQPIDQFVFKDRDGTHYIVYGGWRHCNVARLNDDFTGLVPFPDGTTFQGDHAEGVRRRRLHAAQGRQVLLHVVEGGGAGEPTPWPHAVGSSPTRPVRGPAWA